MNSMNTIPYTFVTGEVKAYVECNIAEHYT